MRMVVTGRYGQLATALVHYGRRHGLEISGLGRPQMDLARPASVGTALALARPDIVLSAAAYTDVEGAEAQPEVAHAINCDGALAVAEACAALGVPLIHISTDYVFAGDKTTAYVETDLCAPRTAYGASKHAGETAIARAHANHAVLRTGWVFSVHGRNFVKTMLAMAARRNVIEVVDDQNGCPTSASALAEAIITIAYRLIDEPANSRLRGVFHAVGQASCSWATFAQGVMNVAEANGAVVAQIVPVSSALTGRPANSSLDCSKLQSVYGMTLAGWETTMPAIVQKLIDEPSWLDA